MIFVAGIHGVGKSFFCSSLSNQLNMPHYSSSQLIFNKKQELYNSNKYIKNPNENQTFLLDSLATISIKERSYILDGHFCLLNQEGEIVKIPESTFLDINPSVVILLIDNVNSIVERLHQRDGKQYDIELMELFQNKELKYAKYITAKLDVPLKVINSREENIEILDLKKYL
jgi:adenylate kinase